MVRVMKYGAFRYGRVVAVTIGAVLAMPLVRAATVSGDAVEVAPNVQHANGNVYDQVLLTSASAEVQADPGQIVRISFVDLNDDIVQVEFSGAGSLKITLEGGTGPASATKYNQPGVQYMRGHPRISISGPDATSNISVFSVNKTTVWANPGIFKEGETYDGVADIAEIEIKPDPANPNGSLFGGIRAGNASFWAYEGRTGIYAPNVHVQSVVRIEDMSAHDAASPTLVFGKNSQFQILDVLTGQLRQANGRMIHVSYQFGLNFMEGGIVWFAPPAPGSPGSYWYLVGHDGTPLLWIVPW